MELQLTFAGGTMSGDGNDDIGAFLIKGRYDAASGECDWTKSYLGAHDVLYRGFREGKGIWGTWKIGRLLHGGFHIWPRRAGEGEEQSERAVQAEPVDAVATISASSPEPSAVPSNAVAVRGGSGLQSAVWPVSLG